MGVGDRERKAKDKGQKENKTEEKQGRMRFEMEFKEHPLLCFSRNLNLLNNAALKKVVVLCVLLERP
jgi:hypothetical protein